MDDELSALTRLPWHWDWVPGPRAGEAARERWAAHVVALFADWTARDPAARGIRPADADTAPLPPNRARVARGARPVEAEFGRTPEAVGHGNARWLRDRADRLPATARLAWGAAFLRGRPRWAPVPVVVEFRPPRDADPAYLLDDVGAKGLDGDAREPVVTRVATPAGDGVRVFAFARGEDGTAYARLDAALRLDVPPDGDGALAGVDVLLATRVFDMGLMAVIGPGTEQLMRQISAEAMPGAGRAPAALRFRDSPGRAAT